MLALLIFALLSPDASALEIQVETHLGAHRSLVLCGSGAGLSWDPSRSLRGQETAPGSGHWKFHLPELQTPIEIKSVIVDDGPTHLPPAWQSGSNLEVVPGRNVEMTDPHFDFTPGTVEVHTQVFVPGQSERTVRVYQPAIQKGGVPAQVIYALDGQNLFSANADGQASWELDRTLDEEIGRGLTEPTVVVGIDHAGALRDFEYLYDQGGADFAQKMFPAVVEWAEARTDLSLDRRKRELLGSSLGALEAAYIGLVAPIKIDFKRLILVSGAFWWKGQDFSAHLVERITSARPSLDLTIGTHEGATSEDQKQALEGVRSMKRALLQVGYREGVDLVYREIPGGTHDEPAWAEEIRSLLAGAAPPVSAAEICAREYQLQSSRHPEK